MDPLDIQRVHKALAKGQLDTRQGWGFLAVMY